MSEIVIGPMTHDNTNDECPLNDPETVANSARRGLPCSCRRLEPVIIAHELKTWSAFFDAVDRGDKTFEVRKNDRGFQKGDVLRLWRFDPQKANYVTKCGALASPCEGIPSSGSRAASVDVRVTYVLSGFGIEPGFVVLGIVPVEPRA